MKKVNIDKKRQKEKYLMQVMTKIYCDGNKHQKIEGHTLCESCQELVEYSAMRTDKCPFMETKTFCSACKVHCYKPDKKELVREVMRYSGPRMLKKHPILAIKHVFTTLKMKLEGRK